MKNKYILLAFLLMTVTGQVDAQVFLPKKAYMHLVGRIDVDKEVTLNLVKINDSLYGDLVYLGDQCEYAMVSGIIDNDGTFLLTYPECDTGKVFRGTFVTRQKISGDYGSKDGKDGQTFVLVESYPEGSIPLQVYYNNLLKYLVSKPVSPQAEISQCLIIPGESSNPVISDTLRLRMISSFTGKETSHEDPDAAISSIQQVFLANYTSSNQSLYESMPDAGSLNWLLLKFMHILYNDNNLLTYYLLNYAYTGGAHGLETQDYTVVSIKTGEIITLQDLFIPGFESRLSPILTSKLKKFAGISPSEKLSDHGFFVDEVIPNNNFYITAGGIGFFYNHYEIAPYANGPTNILVSFEELRGLLIEPGFLSTFLQRR